MNLSMRHIGFFLTHYKNIDLLYTILATFAGFSTYAGYNSTDTCTFFHSNILNNTVSVKVTVEIGKSL